VRFGGTVFSAAGAWLAGCRGGCGAWERFSHALRSFKELGIECHLRCGRLRDLIKHLSKGF